MDRIEEDEPEELPDRLFRYLWIPKSPSGLKMQVLAPFVRSSSFPQRLHFSSLFWLWSVLHFGPVLLSRRRSLPSAIRSPSCNKARRVVSAFGNRTACCGFGCPVAGPPGGTGCASSSQTQWSAGASRRVSRREVKGAACLPPLERLLLRGNVDQDAFFGAENVEIEAPPWYQAQCTDVPRIGASGYIVGRGAETLHQSPSKRSESRVEGSVRRAVLPCPWDADAVS